MGMTQKYRGNFNSEGEKLMKKKSESIGCTEKWLEWQSDTCITYKPVLSLLFVCSQVNSYMASWMFFHVEKPVRILILALKWSQKMLTENQWSSDTESQEWQGKKQGRCTLQAKIEALSEWKFKSTLAPLQVIAIYPQDSYRCNSRTSHTFCK